MAIQCSLIQCLSPRPILWSPAVLPKLALTPLHVPSFLCNRVRMRASVLVCFCAGVYVGVLCGYVSNQPRCDTSALRVSGAHLAEASRDAAVDAAGSGSQLGAAAASDGASRGTGEHPDELEAQLGEEGRKAIAEVKRLLLRAVERERERERERETRATSSSAGEGQGQQQTQGQGQGEGEGQSRERDRSRAGRRSLSLSVLACLLACLPVFLPALQREVCVLSPTPVGHQSQAQALHGVRVTLTILVSVCVWAPHCGGRS